MNRNTEFNLELAKHGMIVKHVYAHKVGTKPKVRFRKFLRSDAYGCYLVDINDPRNSVYLSDEVYFNGHVEMASLDDFIAAGFGRNDYIERPVSAEELAELRHKAIMWDTCVNAGHFPVRSQDGSFAMHYPFGRGSTPAESIDAAMKGGE